MGVDIFTASVSDIPIIEDILLDAVRWLDSVDKSLWTEGQVRWARLSKDFAPSDFEIAQLDGVPAACMAVVDHDPAIWPEVEKGQSLFIHKLAVKRFAAGQGLADAMIVHTRDMCKDRGISTLRLDCSEDRTKLRELYERNGFTCVGKKIVYEIYPVALYQMSL